ncbi:hypothetical protein KNE206_41860 [Kitasatospora sp. NE20-6]|uniref:hypothetical protein n=1 Tax=Kitasatospora sp. NE20-6 TaxID=2859066 RepID=UPI0034DB83E8
MRSIRHGCNDQDLSHQAIEESLAGDHRPVIGFEARETGRSRADRTCGCPVPVASLPDRTARARCFPARIVEAAAPECTARALDPLFT